MDANANVSVNRNANVNVNMYADLLVTVNVDMYECLETFRLQTYLLQPVRTRLLHKP